MSVVDTLVKVLKEAEAADLVLDQDPIGAVLSQRAAAGKLWQEQAGTLMAGLKVCSASSLSVCIHPSPGHLYSGGVCLASLLLVF